jgi:transcription termination factor Rho
MPTPEQILNLAKEYQQSPRHPSILEQFKEGVLLLRSKDASYEKIAATLSSNELKVSAATVRKFCLQHGAEIKRLRNDKQQSSDKSVTGLKPSIPSANRASLVSMSGKPGPKIARDDI